MQGKTFKNYLYSLRVNFDLSENNRQNNLPLLRGSYCSLSWNKLLLFYNIFECNE